MTCQHGLILQDGEYKPSLVLAQRLRNVTIEILRCTVCGEESIGWYRQEDTEDDL